VYSSSRLSNSFFGTERICFIALLNFSDGFSSVAVGMACSTKTQFIYAGAQMPNGNEIRISIEIKNTQPIELIDLTGSLVGFADEYKRRIAISDPLAPPEEIKLYVKEMRTGSIIADLIAIAPLTLPFVADANHVIQFCQYLSQAYKYLTGQSREKPEMEKVDYLNLNRIVEPVAKDSGAQINIGTVNITAPVTLTLNSLEANAAQNKAKREIELLQEPVTGVKEGVVLYWYQARNDPRSQAGDKAIIESIYSGAVKAIFASEAIKAKMLLDTDNPFTHAYVVDVAVETIKGRPVVYRIQNVHEVIEKPPELPDI
jgi:hypothetical protein